MTNNAKRIDAYSLLDFVQAVEQAVKEGYTMCTSNENYPQQFGTFYTAGMVKVGKQQHQQQQQQETIVKPSKSSFERVSEEASTQGTPEQENASEAVLTVPSGKRKK